MPENKHLRLVIPGPVEVRPEILQAQTAWMVGHRSGEFAELLARLQPKLKQAFLTDNRVLVVGASGTGLWEGASRNCVRDGHKVLHLTGGAFSERWAEVSQANGKDVDVIAVDWGQGHTPEMVADALKKEHYDAVCVVHNETSTGVLNPVKAIGEAVRQYDDTLYLVDTVSGILGAEFRTDEWGVDVALTSSQKAFALPPGLAFAAVSDRVLERAAGIAHRGYYFDFLELDARLQKNNTPSTPPISLMFAADVQLDDVLAEGLDARWQRHLEMRNLTHGWAARHGFDLFAPEGFRSPTVTAVDNRQKQMDVDAMAAHMKERGYTMDRGYGKIKGQTFRIAHMGDMPVAELKDILTGLDEFMG